MIEVAVKSSDLENFDPDTPLEKLRWARAVSYTHLTLPTILLV